MLPINIETDRVAQFGDETRVLRQLELALRLQTLGVPGALNRFRAEPCRLCDRRPGSNGSSPQAVPRALARACARRPSGLMRDPRILTRSEPPHRPSIKRCCQTHTQVLELSVRMIRSCRPQRRSTARFLCPRPAFFYALRSGTAASNRRISAGERDSNFPMRLRKRVCALRSPEGSLPGLKSRVRTTRVIKRFKKAICGTAAPRREDVE